MILYTWFDHLGKSLFLKEFWFKMFCLAVKTTCPPGENVSESPDLLDSDNLC